YAELTAGLTDALERQGKMVFLTQGGRSGEKMAQRFDTLAAQGGDGGIIAGAIDRGGELRGRAGGAGGVPAGLGHPLSRLPRVQEKVGQIAGLLLVNRSLLEQAAALRFSAIEANLAKVTITDNAIQAVNIALELTGNHGLSRQNPLERHYRNVLCGRVHTPQSDSAWLAAGNFVFQSQG
ncbi:acyl-CoA dehydrogenase family protein, partial [Klebsiella pneumoniae]|nr:acyl-CoA dehydrogenase family protein [Klebsiella pneumoniae]